MTETGNFFNRTSGLPDINMDKKLPRIRTSLPKVDLKLFETVDSDENLDGLSGGDLLA